MHLRLFAPRLRPRALPRPLGHLEFEPFRGIAFEAHILYSPGETTWLFWPDEWGRPWGLVEAGRA